MVEKITENATIVAAENLLSCDLVGEILLYHLDSKKHFKLESIGAVIWRLIQEPRSLRELRFLLMDRYDIDEETCENDLREWSEKLLSEGVIEIIPPTAKP